MKSIRVEDYMNKHPVTFDINMTVAEASEKLIHSPQNGGPVVDNYHHDYRICIRARVFRSSA